MGQVIGKGDVYAGSKDGLWTGAGEGKMAATVTKLFSKSSGYPHYQYSIWTSCTRFLLSGLRFERK